MRIKVFIFLGCFTFLINCKKNITLIPQYEQLLGKYKDLASPQTCIKLGKNDISVKSFFNNTSFKIQNINTSKGINNKSIVSVYLKNMKYGVIIISYKNSLDSLSITGTGIPNLSNNLYLKQ